MLNSNNDNDNDMLSARIIQHNEDESNCKYSPIYIIIVGFVISVIAFITIYYSKF
jgi:hypothetical protein